MKEEGSISKEKHIERVLVMKYIKAKAILLADHKEEEAYLIVNDDGTFGQVDKEHPDQAEVID